MHKPFVMNPEHMKTMKKQIIALLAFGLFVAAGTRVAAEPVAVMDLVHRSQEAAQLNQMKEAIALAHQATETDAAYAGGWKQLGALLLQQKKYAEAIDPLQTAISLEPQNSSALRDSSTAHWLAGPGWGSVRGDDSPGAAGWTSPLRQ